MPTGEEEATGQVVEPEQEQATMHCVSAGHTPEQLTPQRHSAPKRSLTLPRILVPHSPNGSGGGGGGNGRGGF